MFIIISAMMPYNEYERIIDDDDPKLIKNVSMLRHHINVHGVTDKLMDFLKISEEELCDVCELCRGDTPIRKIIDHCEECIDEESERLDRIENAKIKNDALILSFHQCKETFCGGIGLRKTKLRLNKLAKEGCKMAKILRIALETEDANIRAKESYGIYAEKLYRKKEELIRQLLNECKDTQIQYGYQMSDNPSARYIIYIEFQDGTQISWHTADYTLTDGIPEYKNDWDCLVNSTLPKLECLIGELFKTTFEC